MQEQNAELQLIKSENQQLKADAAIRPVYVPFLLENVGRLHVGRIT